MVVVRHGAWRAALWLSALSGAAPAELRARLSRLRALRLSLFFFAPRLRALLEAVGARPRRGAQPPRAGGGLRKAGAVCAPREVSGEGDLDSSRIDFLFTNCGGSRPSGSMCNNNKETDSNACFRLFWPKSRCYDYLYQEAEALLKNFPVQATISFYEDSDSEEDEGELEQDSRTESHC
ncbi:hypothetical protein CIB84_011249 [Bambusicola thoracicus]|uniref:Protein ripply2 n=1 Tax=Bambusicola thoracicus TaxID=9083 RepID=A0A2P4SLK5_BAMTH|nr:hypothetical protein CIB84_011249 [Bambusicola thoracicus]